MRKTSSLFLLCLALTFGCDGGLTGPDGLAVRHDDLALHIMNRYSIPVHFILIERDDLPLIDWLQCTAVQESCPTIGPGQTAVVPYTDIVGYDPGDDEAVLYWWMTSAVSGVRRPTSPQSVVISLNRVFVVR